MSAVPNQFPRSGSGFVEPLKASVHRRRLVEGVQPSVRTGYGGTFIQVKVPPSSKYFRCVVFQIATHFYSSKITVT